MNLIEKWEICKDPQKGNKIKWIEPLWAAPNKPRGKRDKLGNQEITAIIISIGETFELQVVSVNKVSLGNALLTVKKDDIIIVSINTQSNINIKTYARQMNNSSDYGCY